MGREKKSELLEQLWCKERRVKFSEKDGDNVQGRYLQAALVCEKGNSIRTWAEREKSWRSWEA